MNLFGALTHKQLCVAATRTATVTGTGVDIKGAEGDILINQSVGTVTGTSPTLDTKIQDSADNSSWSDVSGATFTQVTATPSTANAVTSLVLQSRTLRRYVRAVGTITGTSPSFPLSVTMTYRTKDI